MVGASGASLSLTGGTYSADACTQASKQGHDRRLQSSTGQLLSLYVNKVPGASFYEASGEGKLLVSKLHMSAKGDVVTESEHLPNRKIKSDTELAIDEFVGTMSDIYPNLDQEELREQVSSCVQEHVPGEGEGAEEEEEEKNGVGVMSRAKGLAKEAAGAVTRNEETKAEGRLEKEGGTTEGNKAYFRSVIEETNKRATDEA